MDSLIDTDEAKRLVCGSWGKQLNLVVMNCIAPFYYIEPQFDHVPLIRNGTIFFLDTGKKKFAVSAYHVYLSYKKAVTSNNKTFCQVLGERFDPDKCLIDFSEKLDLVTFEVTDKQIEKIGKNFFTGYQSNWPPAPPQTGKGVFFAGCPGREKNLMNPPLLIGVCALTFVLQNLLMKIKLLFNSRTSLRSKIKIQFLKGMILAVLADPL